MADAGTAHRPRPSFRAIRPLILKARGGRGLPVALAHRERLDAGEAGPHVRRCALGLVRARLSLPLSGSLSLSL